MTTKSIDEPIDAALIAWCKATGFNPEHREMLREPMWQAIEAHKAAQPQPSADCVIEHKQSISVVCDCLGELQQTLWVKCPIHEAVMPPRKEE